MEEVRAEVGGLQREGQRRCREAIGKSYAILGKSSNESGVTRNTQPYKPP